MVTFRPVALLVGLALLPTGAHAQGFLLEEIESLAKLPVAELKPGTIAFADRPGTVQDGVFVRYEDWAKSNPLQQQFLSLYPSNPICQQERCL